jgi:hypothetical protein
MNRTCQSLVLGLLLAAHAVGSVAAAEEIYSRPGRYLLDAEGWELQTGSEGALLLRCRDCRSPVQVQIDYGPERSGADTEGGNAAFLAALATEETQKQFAQAMLEASLPEEVLASEEVELTIAKVGKIDFGGLSMFRYVAMIDGGGDKVTQESTLVAIHHNRIVKLALNHYHDALDDTAKKRIATLFTSVRFDPEVPAR